MWVMRYNNSYIDRAVFPMSWSHITTPRHLRRTGHPQTGAGPIQDAQDGAPGAQGQGIEDILTFI